MRDRYNVKLTKWFTGLLLVAALALSGGADIKAVTLDEIVAGAKKEGEVRVAISVRKKIGKFIQAPRLIDAFQKRYPGIDVKHTYMGGFRRRERVFSEMVGGVVKHDAATFSTRQVDDGIKANLFASVDWKGLGVAPEVVHPTNSGVIYRPSTFGIGYNTDLVPDDAGQKLKWEDCTDPKWKGKFATVDRPRHLEVLYQNNAWGSEKTLDYARRFAANAPVIQRGRSEAVVNLSAGSYSLLCGVRWGGLMQQIGAGSKNLGIAFPEPVPVVYTDHLFVSRGAKNPNAGILWVIWSLSHEGQKMFDEVEFTGDPLFPGSAIYSRVKGKKVVRASWEYLARADDVLREILTAMGFPVVQ